MCAMIQEPHGGDHVDENADSTASSISVIREKQRLLKRVIIITRAIERMQDSLNSVLILGQPSTDIPDGMLKYFYLLSNKIKQKPTDKIRRYLNQLEQIIKAGLQAIVDISRIEHDIDSAEQASNVAEKPYSDKAMHLLREFNRQAQTAVSLKVLLQQRGVHTPGTVVKIPLHLIKGQLKCLAQTEEIQRNKIKVHISDMQNDLKIMLESSEYTDEMKDMFRNVMVGLENDMRAISQGARIDQLPFSFEMIETGDDKQHLMQPSNKLDEVESVDLPEEMDQPDDVDQPEEIGRSEDMHAYSRKRGFFRTLFKWLNTPWSVTWDAVKRKNR
jgi:hypothetical protein